MWIHIELVVIEGARTLTLPSIQGLVIDVPGTQRPCGRVLLWGEYQRYYYSLPPELRQLVSRVAFEEATREWVVNLPDNPIRVRAFFECADAAVATNLPRAHGLGGAVPAGVVAWRTVHGPFGMARARFARRG